MKMFRKDRLHQSDRDRFTFLTENLKKNRVIDDQNIYNIGANPARAGNSKDANGRVVSPSKISPNKQGTQNSKQLTDSSHSNNGQVMTQISAIYAKRSRSILNQFG